MVLSKHFMKKLGQFFKKHRINSGLSQRAVADTIGCTGQFVMNWERGICVPPLKYWPTLIKLLKIPTRDLLNVLSKESDRHWRSAMQSEGNRQINQS